jgi:hypothetical protein
MALFHTDQPILGDAKSPDRLNREEFAKRISRGLLLDKNSPGIVVSIEGPWGYGKTSLVNLINKHFNQLDKKEKPIVVNFNPWMASGVENLVQEFLVQLASIIGLSDSAKATKDAAKQLLAYSNIFSALKYIPGVEPWASIVQNVIKGVGKSADAIGKLKELSIDEKRDKVITALKKLDRTIVIFIDDIDRLPPSEVFDMVRLVKAVADFPRVAFVLLYEAKYIEEALNRYGIADTKLYLDKIVQARMTLPLVSADDLEALVNEELSKLPVEAMKEYFPDNSHRLSELYQISIKRLLQSPRDVKRLFNRLYLSESAVRGEVAFPDLFALESILLKAPLVYDHIRTNPGAYTGVPPNVPFFEHKPENHVKLHIEERERIINQLPNAQREQVKALLSKLFPLLDESRYNYDQNYYSTRGRIAATNRLIIALSYGVPTKEVPITLVKQFLEVDEKRKSIIDVIISKALLERFLELIKQNISEIKITNLEGLLLLMADVAESEFVSEQESKSLGRLGVGPLKQIWWTVEACLNHQDKARRVQYLKTMMKDPARLSLGTLGLNYCLRQHGFFEGSGPETPDDSWCTEAQLNELKDVWVKATAEAINSRTFCKMSGKGQIYFLLKRVDLDKTKELTTMMIVADNDLDCLVSAYGVTGTDSIKGRYAHVTPDFLNEVGSVEAIRTRVAVRLKSKTPLNQDLKSIYNSMLTGKLIYLIDNSEGDPF